MNTRRRAHGHREAGISSVLLCHVSGSAAFLGHLALVARWDVYIVVTLASHAVLSRFRDAGAGQHGTTIDHEWNGMDVHGCFWTFKSVFVHRPISSLTGLFEVKKKG